MAEKLGITDAHIITSPDPKTITQELPISHLRQLFEHTEFAFSGNLSEKERDVMGHVRLFGPESPQPVRNTVYMRYFAPGDIELHSHILPQDKEQKEKPLLHSIKNKILHIDASKWIEPRNIESTLPHVLQAAHIPLVTFRLGYIPNPDKESTQIEIPVADLFYPRGWDAFHALQQMKDSLLDMYYPQSKTRPKDKAHIGHRLNKVDPLSIPTWSPRGIVFQYPFSSQ